MANKTSNLIELLQRRVQQQPLQTAYTFLNDGEAEEINLTYEQIDRRARAIAACLQALRAKGERVLLLYPLGLEYISAFWGCLYAGAIAVPAYPPRQNRSLLRLQSVVTDAQSTLALTTSSLLSKVDALTAQCAELKQLRWLATETIPDKMAQEWRSPSVGCDDLAFLQYTSGSTSTPKGVMVTHGNLLHNERMIQEAFRQTEQSVIVGWLPLYHDMGLIGNVLQPVYAGAQCVLMSPLAFLQNPFRWLSAISRYHATTSGGPNFAYDLCVRKISVEQRAQLDLSSWEVAFNGAEPVRADTMKAFAEAFAPSGFRPDAFRPCYGLAEATLLVSSDAAAHGSPLVKTVEAEALQSNLVVEATAGVEGARTLVSCGPPPTGQQVFIYRPETFTECLPGEVGEICVSGANVTKGYWNRPEETARTFQSRVSQGQAEPLLRTGDLGVMLDGNLFVTGRIKDLIIIRGRNHYPHDIERTVEQSHPSLRLGAGAAFVVEIAGKERLVVAQEVNVRRQLDAGEIIRAINEAVAEEHELQLYAVALLKTGSIPKTSSGKIQRHACREKFLSKSFDAVTEWELPLQPESEVETSIAEPDLQDVASIAAWLRAEVAAKLGTRASDIEVNRPISHYALDSLAAIELTHLIEAKLGVMLPMASLLQSPTIAELAVQTQQLAGTAGTKTIVAATHETASNQPLSRGQQALWFLYQLAPDNATYNISTAVRITSALDVSALRRAFQSLLHRHPSLRSTFSTQQDEPVQRILDQVEVHFEETNASELSEAELNNRLAEEADCRFDLEHGPLLRVHLFARAENDHVILLVVHHIVADFWSLSVLTNELGMLYTAEVEGTSAQLPSTELQYSDYVRQQEAMLESTEGEKLWSYWRQQLTGELPVLNLPADHRRPPVQTYSGNSEAFKLSAELTRGLKDLSREHGATLYMTLLAAFQTLLYRYTGQEDILVGSPTSGRNQNGLTGLVGYFVNPIVLRARPSARAPFATFLEETKQTVLSALEHQAYPFPLLVERLQPEREPSRSPLFQAMFILQKAHLLNEEGLASFALGEAGARVKLGALELESVTLKQRISQFDLTLVMVEAGETLSASLQYNTALFESSTIAKMVEHLETLLQGIIAKPQQSLSELPMLTRLEEQQLLSGWNQTRAAYPQDLCLHQLFEQQVARTPEHIALICDERRVSYSELDRRANRLAHHLRSLGVGAEVFVGLLLRRRDELVVALLAVLKAGGSYLPLEASYPVERLRFMLQDTCATILLTEESLLDLAGELLSTYEAVAGAEDSEPTHVVCLERDREAISNRPETAPFRTATSYNMAYVIYTSGSTGTPKGVIINHSSAVLMAQWAGEYFTPAQLAGVLASTSISFDLSVFELFAPLSTGGTVILADNALQLPTIAASSEVTLVNTVPSAMAELVRNGFVPSNVRTVNLAGEALSRELVEQLYGLETVTEVVNLYGPSEDTTYSTFALIERGAESAPEIGRPLANTQAYVLDAVSKPVPVGVTGELYLGGEGLGRGYWRRPELTAQRFVPDPFSGVGGARLYRTGDLVRYRKDGVLEYLGRIDHQVKVRGYRIELGEIESALRKHEEVREAVVVVSVDDRGEQRLVAYVVTQEQAASVGAEVGATGATELRGWMRERLPEYMVPQGFVLLAELPLTANGKVDRRALPACQELDSGNVAEVVEPRTETEEAVAELWREVLGVERVSVDDNFFEVGGHSLLATRMMSQVRKRFGVEVSLRSFFERASVEGLAQLIELAGQSAQVSNAPTLKAVPRIGNPPLSFAQQRLWFLHQLEPESTAYNMPAATRLTGNLNIEALEQSLTEIISRHEVMRTIFVMEDDEPMQLVSPARPVRIPLIDLCHLSAVEREAEAMRLAKAEAERPFDLSRAPLVRFTLLQLGAADHMLLLTMHHIVFDGWSIGVLIDELTTLYRAYNSGHDSPLAALPLQYADYAVWQREWLQGGALEEQLSYWRQQLAQAPEGLNLPIDKPRPAVQSINGASLSFKLSTALVASLKALAQEEGATMYMALLAAFQILLSRYSGQTDVLVGAVVANRNRAEIEGLIGFFVNMLVMRGDLSSDPDFRAYLGMVRETALEAYAHQDVPFDVMVESLQVGRHLDRSPLFQVAFVLQNTPTAELELDDIKLNRLETDEERAQFDLTLSLTETDDGGMTGSLNYNTDLFYAASIERMQEHFKTLLEGIVARPQQRLSELPLLTQAEQHQILFDWNHNPACAAPQLCIHELFEEQARLMPQTVAVVSGEEQITYAELNSRANRLAHYLRSLGVGAEVTVGLCVERSIEMVVGMLGILKAGGAYVPLDPAYPAERLKFMLEDSGLKVLLTQKSLLTVLPEHTAQVMCLDTEWESVAGYSVANLSCEVTAGSLAYIIYTSGSTGQPKGVMIQHSSISNFVESSSLEFGLVPSDRVLQFASYSFDTSAEEIYPTLASGATLVLRNDEMLASASEFLRTCLDWDVSVLNLPTAYWHELASSMSTADRELLGRIRLVIIGGEKAQAQRFEDWQKHVSGDVRLLNEYGPTETTVVVTLCELPEKTGGACLSPELPIGRPIQRVQVYVLDKRMQPAPVGIPGELYIGGAALGRGYLNRPELTVEKFVPHPFSEIGGERLYRTGDLVKYRADGMIEYLGRIDQQVKLRGFRIELGEIEAALLQHTHVGACVVTLSEDGSREKLVAYFTTSEGGDVPGELRAYLRAHLPEYMIPSAFVQLAEMPLTPNGKIDRRALPSAAGQEQSGGEVTEPRTETEEAVAELWREVLGVERVSVDDNFFEVGGHSLLATRMMSQVRKRFGVEVSLRSFFERASVEGLAQLIELAQLARSTSTAPAIIRASRENYRMKTSLQGALVLPEALRKEAMQK